MNLKNYSMTFVGLVVVVISFYFIYQYQDNTDPSLQFEIPEGWIIISESRRGTNGLVSYISPDSDHSNPNAEIKVISVLSSESLPPEESMLKEKIRFADFDNIKNFTDSVSVISGISVYEGEYEMTRGSDAEMETVYSKTLRFTDDVYTYNVSGMYKVGSGDQHSLIIEDLKDRLSFP